MTQHGSRRAFRRFRTFIAETRQANLLRNLLPAQPAVESLHQFSKSHSLYHTGPGWRYYLNPRRNPLHKGSEKLTRQELQAEAVEKTDKALL